jgi:bifunctional ADP-heptose synthase (sugar kinase/adenylyltransferase)
MYWVGTVAGVSAEAPVPVLKQSSVSAMPGMAGNVQKLLQDLGHLETSLIIGQTPHLPIKNRLMTEGGDQLARWDIEDWCTSLVEEDLNITPAPDAIIICDYAKGAISLEAVKKLRSLCESGIPLFVDTKGDPFVWIGLEQVTLFPNQLEYSRWKDHYDWMPSVVWKQGAQGMSYLRFGKELEHQSATCSRPLNVCGAGDSVIAAWVSASLTHVTTETPLHFASVIAGEFVSRPFNERYTGPR